MYWNARCDAICDQLNDLSHGLFTLLLGVQNAALALRSLSLHTFEPVECCTAQGMWNGQEENVQHCTL